MDQPQRIVEIPAITTLQERLGFGRRSTRHEEFRNDVNSTINAFTTSDGRNGRDLIAWDESHQRDFYTMATEFFRTHGSKYWPHQPSEVRTPSYYLEDEEHHDHEYYKRYMMQLFLRVNIQKLRNTKYAPKRARNNQRRVRSNATVRRSTRRSLPASSPVSHIHVCSEKSCNDNGNGDDDDDDNRGSGSSSLKRRRLTEGATPADAETMREAAASAIKTNIYYRVAIRQGGEYTLDSSKDTDCFRASSLDELKAELLSNHSAPRLKLQLKGYRTTMSCITRTHDEPCFRQIGEEFETRISECVKMGQLDATPPPALSFCVTIEPVWDEA